jgi:mono/diheme cytochrome c family protein
MKRTIVALALPVALAAALVTAAGCASLATPEAPGSGSPSPGATATVAVSQQVKDGAQLYVDFACVRCHAPDGVGGVPNRLNVGGDDDIPPLNNAYRDPSEKFTNVAQITTVLNEGSIISKKAGVINMPSWKGVLNTAQENAIAAYILAGLPRTGVQVDFDPTTGPAIYEGYACIQCHGQVGANATPSPAPNPLTADKVVPLLRNPADNVALKEFMATIMNGSIPAPGTKGVLLMPAWGQIMSTQEVAKILPYIQDGPKGATLPPPPAYTPPPLSGGSATASGSPAPSGSSSP